MNYTITNEDISIVEKFIEIKNRGLYANGSQVTEAYNRILHQNVRPTNCGSCIRGRIQELENALNDFKRKIKAQEQIENDKVNVSPDENKTSEEAENKSAIKRVGRPKKK